MAADRPNHLRVREDVQQACPGLMVDYMLAWERGAGCLGPPANELRRRVGLIEHLANRVRRRVCLTEHLANGGVERGLVTTNVKFSPPVYHNCLRDIISHLMAMLNR